MHVHPVRRHALSWGLFQALRLLDHVSSPYQLSQLLSVLDVWLPYLYARSPSATPWIRIRAIHLRLQQVYQKISISWGSREQR